MNGKTSNYCLEEEVVKKESLNDENLKNPYELYQSEIFPTNPEDIQNYGFEKLEDVEVKEEPFDEEMPKLESIFENSSENQKENLHLLAKRKVLQDIRNREVMKMRGKPIEVKNCSLCLQLENVDLMKTATENDKLILFVASFIHKKYPESILNQSDSLSICNFHFPESANQIFKSLQIKTLLAVDKCTSLAKQNLMLAVNSFSPKMKFWQFFNEFFVFAAKNKHLTGIRTTGFKELTPEFEREKQVVIVKKPVNPQRRVFTPEEQQFVKCQLCHHLRCHLFVNNLSNENEKLVIAVACILRNDLSLRNAFSFMSRTDTLQVCQQHYHDASNEIFNFLKIENAKEAATCSRESKERLMFTVNLFHPNMTIEQFSHILHNFRFLL